MKLLEGGYLKFIYMNSMILNSECKGTIIKQPSLLQSQNVDYIVKEPQVAS
jgi:hypothetical protein